MFLSRFGVKNYKCLEDIDIPLTPIHVLIGQNDAGKTSLLEALAVFYGSAESEIPPLLPQPWQGRELVFHGSDEPLVELAGEWTRSPDDKEEAPKLEYSFVIKFLNRGTSVKIQEEISNKHAWPDQPTSTRLSMFNRGIKAVPHEAIEASDLIKILHPAYKYALNPKLMAVPAAIDPGRRFRLDPDGFGLATLLDDILGYDAELFIRLRSEFCQYFPQFRSVRIETEPALKRTYQPNGIHSSGQATGKGIYFETQDGQSLRAQQASDGAILFLAILALAHLPQPPTLLLLEEPENGIYPRRLGEVVAMLKEMVHRAEGVRFPQIIMSTHSPYVLSFFEPEEVTFLSRRPGEPTAGVRARPMRDASHIRERLAGGEFYLGELWYNLDEEDLFGGS